MAVTIRVDKENNADEFWGHLDERFPDVARSLREDDWALVPSAKWDAIRGLPGFADGPEHAREALICDTLELNYVILPHSDSHTIECWMVRKALDHIERIGWDADYAGLVILDPSDVGEWFNANCAHHRVRTAGEWTNPPESWIACYVVDWDEVVG